MRAVKGAELDNSVPAGQGRLRWCTIVQVVAVFPRQAFPIPDRRQSREPETGVKLVFACTLTRHLWRERLYCGHRLA
jgi:hypothetical protein